MNELTRDVVPANESEMFRRAKIRVEQAKKHFEYWQQEALNTGDASALGAMRRAFETYSAILSEFNMLNAPNAVVLEPNKPPTP